MAFKTIKHQATIYNDDSIYIVCARGSLALFTLFANYEKKDTSFTTNISCLYCKHTPTYTYKQTTRRYKDSVVKNTTGTKYKSSCICESCFMDVLDSLAIYERAIMWLIERELPNRDKQMINAGIMCTDCEKSWWIMFTTIRDLLGADITGVVYDIVLRLY